MLETRVGLHMSEEVRGIFFSFHPRRGTGTWVTTVGPEHSECGLTRGTDTGRFPSLEIC